MVDIAVKRRRIESEYYQAGYIPVNPGTPAWTLQNVTQAGNITTLQITAAEATEDTHLATLGQVNSAVGAHDLQAVTDVGNVATNYIDLTYEEVITDKAKHQVPLWSNGEPIIRNQTHYWNGSDWELSYGYGFGIYALENNTGVNSDGFGYYALSNNIGDRSTGIGYYALSNNSGDRSVGVGSEALRFNTGLYSNAIGYQALRYNTGSSSNAIGYGSLQYNQGNFNTALGHTTSNANPFILTNTTALGYNAQPTASNQVKLGDNNVTEVLTSGTVTHASPTLSTHSALLSDVEDLETDIADGYVPYTGAIANVDLGLHTLAADGVISPLTENAQYVSHIVNPEGGVKGYSTGVVTGAVVIKSPSAFENSYTHYRLKLVISKQGASPVVFEIDTRWLNGYFIDLSTYSLSAEGEQYKISVGTDGVNQYFIIGDVTDTWTRVEIVLSEVTVGYAYYDIDVFKKGWEITNETDLSGITINKTVALPDYLAVTARITKGSTSTMPADEWITIAENAYLPSTWSYSGTIEVMRGGRCNLVFDFMYSGNSSITLRNYSGNSDYFEGIRINNSKVQIKTTAGAEGALEYRVEGIGVNALASPVIETITPSEVISFTNGQSNIYSRGMTILEGLDVTGTVTHADGILNTESATVGQLPDMTLYVPYFGATGGVDLNEQDLTNVYRIGVDEYINISSGTSPTLIIGDGSAYWEGPSTSSFYSKSGYIGLVKTDAININKEARFDFTSITDSYTRNYTLPDKDGTLALLGDITDLNIGTIAVFDEWSGTQAEYDALGTYDAGTYYFIEGSGGSVGLELGETSTTAYRGDRGKIAYDHSLLTTGNPHAVTATDVGLGNVENAAASGLYEPLFSKNTGFNLNLGTTTGTVAEGDDSRFTDARETTSTWQDVIDNGTATVTNQISHADGTLAGHSATMQNVWDEASVDYGAATRIPYMNVAGDGFLYSAALLFDGSNLLQVGNSSSTGTSFVVENSSAKLTVFGTSIKMPLYANSVASSSGYGILWGKASDKGLYWTNVDGTYDLLAGGGGGGTVTEVTSSTTDQLTVATSTTTPALTIVTAAVADAGTALATGDQIYDFVIGLGYTTLALGETITTAYRGDRGKTAYDHSQLVTGNPHSVTYSEISGTPDLTSYVIKTGIPVNNQIAVWTDTDTIEGDANLTFDGTELKVSDLQATDDIIVGDRATIGNTIILYGSNGNIVANAATIDDITLEDRTTDPTVISGRGQFYPKDGLPYFKDDAGNIHSLSAGGSYTGNHSDLTLDDGTNPHGTTQSDVGLGNVENAAASGLYEPIFSKNTGFNLNLGTTAGTVLEGRTFGTIAVFDEWSGTQAQYDALGTYDADTYYFIEGGNYGLVLGETSTTAYRGDRGKTAYDYSQIGHLPLTGGTLTGALNGTTAAFSGTVTAVGGYINTNTGTTPFYVGRLSGTSQGGMSMYSDDATAIISTEQDENVAGYANLYINLGNQSAQAPKFRINDTTGGSDAVMFQVDNLGSGEFTGTVTHAAPILSTQSALLSDVTSAIAALGTITTYDAWTGTQAQYDALGTYDNDTFYFIEEA